MTPMFTRIARWFREHAHEHDWKCERSENYTSFRAYHYKCRTCPATKLETRTKSQTEMLADLIELQKRTMGRAES